MKSLGYFKPKPFQFGPSIQWAEFIRTHMPEGFYLYGYPEFRGKRTRVDPEVCEWHHDLNSDVRPKTYLVTWANICTTQVKHVDGGGGIVKIDRYTAAIFNNDRWMHRQPEMTASQRKRRQFARAWLTRDHDLALNYFAEEAF